eukprot:gene26545-12937_t
MNAADAAKKTHLASIEVVPDQNARGNDPNFAICGAPSSRNTFPQWRAQLQLDAAVLEDTNLWLSIYVVVQPNC